MKKAIAIGVIVVTAVSIWWLLLRDESVPQVENKHQAIDSVQQESMPRVEEIEQKQSPINLASTQQTEDETEQEKQPNGAFSNLECWEKLQVDNPSVAQKFDALLEQIFLADHEMTSSGAYTQMPEESLVSLANAQDTTAMLVHGSNLVWQGAIGVKVYRNEQYAQKIDRSKIKQHQMDFEKIAQGEEYLYQAAVLGKYGALLELSALAGLQARRLIRKDGDKDKIKELMAKNVAYNSLLNKVHQHDPVLARFINNDPDSFNKALLKQMYQNEQQIEQAMNEIKAIANQESDYLLNKWKNNRDYYGLEYFPRVVDSELEQFMNEAHEKCFSDRD